MTMECYHEDEKNNRPHALAGYLAMALSGCVLGALLTISAARFMGYC